MLDGSGVQGNGHLFVFKQERGVCMRRDVRGEEAYPPASVVVMVVLVVVGHRAAIKADEAANATFQRVLSNEKQHLNADAA